MKAFVEEEEFGQESNISDNFSLLLHVLSLLLLLLLLFAYCQIAGVFKPVTESYFACEIFIDILTSRKLT